MSLCSCLQAAAAANKEAATAVALAAADSAVEQGKPFVVLQLQVREGVRSISCMYARLNIYQDVVLGCDTSSRYG